MTLNLSFVGLAEPDFERLIQFTPPLMAPPWTPREDWDLSAFCLHPYPFSLLLIASTFFTLRLFYKIAKYQCRRALSNRVESVAQPLLLPVMSISCASFWNRPCSQAELHWAQCRKMAELDGSAGYHQVRATSDPRAADTFSLTPGQLSEVGDLISGIQGVLCDPCNFTASWVIACDFHRNEMMHQGTVRIPAAHRQAEYKVPTKTAVGPLAKIYF